jgi:xanthine/uracil permease
MLLNGTTPVVVGVVGWLVGLGLIKYIRHRLMCEAAAEGGFGEVDKMDGMGYVEEFDSQPLIHSSNRSYPI